MPKKFTYDDTDSPIIPPHVWKSFTRVLYPIIVQYYESDEGKQAYADWQEKNGPDPDCK